MGSEMCIRDRLKVMSILSREDAEMDVKCLVVTSGSVDVDVDVPHIDVTDEAAEKDSEMSSLSFWKAQLMSLVRQKVKTEE